MYQPQVPQRPDRSRDIGAQAKPPPARLPPRRVNASAISRVNGVSFYGTRSLCGGRIAPRPVFPKLGSAMEADPGTEKRVAWFTQAALVLGTLLVFVNPT